MGKAQEACALLERKKQLFEDYAEETRALAVCGIDEIEERMAARDRLARTIDGTSAQLDALCGGDPGLAVAAHGRGARPADAGYAAVFDHAREVRGIVERIGQVEAMVSERFRRERDGLTEKIKGSNRGMAATAARYFSGARGGEASAASFAKI